MTSIVYSVFSNDLLAKIEYPSASTGSASTSSTDDQSFSYAALSYNLRGDVTNDGTYAYAYDANDRMISVTPDDANGGGQKLTYGNDSQGRRIWKNVYTYGDAGASWDFDYSHSYVYDGTQTQELYTDGLPTEEDQLDNGEGLIAKTTYTYNGMRQLATQADKTAPPSSYYQDGTQQFARGLKTADPRRRRGSLVCANRKRMGTSALCDGFELPLGLGEAELGQGVDGGLALAGADDGAVAFVGLPDRVRLAGRRPGGAIAAEDQVVLDGQFQAQIREFLLYCQYRRIGPAIRKSLQIFSSRAPAGIEQTLNGVFEIHHSIAPCRIRQGWATIVSPSK